MAFQFKIEEGVEVHKDPLGHYHHWTILTGKLLEGTVRQGDCIKIPLADGTMLAAHVGGFNLASQTLGSEVSAGQYDRTFGMMTWRPAAQNSEVLRDVAQDCTTEEFQSILLGILQNHPTRIFHSRGVQAGHLDCHGCVVIPNTSEVAAILQNLQTSTDTYIARRASLVLQKWAAPPAELQRKKPRTTLLSPWNKK